MKATSEKKEQFLICFFQVFVLVGILDGFLHVLIYSGDYISNEPRTVSLGWALSCN